MFSIHLNLIIIIFILFKCSTQQSPPVKPFFCDTEETSEEVLNYENLKRFFVFDGKLFFIFKKRVIFTKVPKYVYPNKFVHYDFYEQIIDEPNYDQIRADLIFGHFYDIDYNITYALIAGDEEQSKTKPPTVRALEFNNHLGKMGRLAYINPFIRDRYLKRDKAKSKDKNGNEITVEMNDYNKTFSAITASNKVFFIELYRSWEDKQLWLAVYLNYDVKNGFSYYKNAFRNIQPPNLKNSSFFAIDIDDGAKIKFQYYKLFDPDNKFTVSMMTIDHDKPNLFNLHTIIFNHDYENLIGSKADFYLQYSYLNLMTYHFSNLFSCHSRFRKFNQIKGIYFNLDKQIFYVFIKRFYLKIERPDRDLVDEGFKLTDNDYLTKGVNIKLPNSKKCQPLYEIQESKWIKTFRDHVYFSSDFKCGSKLATVNENEVFFPEPMPLNIFQKCSFNTLQIGNSVYCFTTTSYNRQSTMDNLNSLAQGSAKIFRIKNIFTNADDWNEDQKLMFIFNYILDQVVFMTVDNLFIIRYEDFTIMGDFELKLKPGTKVIKTSNYLYQRNTNVTTDPLDYPDETDLPTKIPFNGYEPESNSQKFIFIILGIIVLMTALFLIFHLISKDKGKYIKVRSKKFLNFLSGSRLASAFNRKSKKSVSKSRSKSKSSHKTTKVSDANESASSAKYSKSTTPSKSLSANKEKSKTKAKGSSKSSLKSEINDKSSVKPATSGSNAKSEKILMIKSVKK